MSKIFPPTAENIARAASLLRDGTPVAFATETVYGLGADARSDAGVAAVYAMKSRPQFNPLIAHVLDADMVAEYVVWNETAQALAKAFWPGPLTLVLPRKGLGIGHWGGEKKKSLQSLKPNPQCLEISLLASAGLESVAVRAPSHAVARALIKECGFPLAAPSANRSGRVSPTTAEHVAEEFADISMILDGGACEVGIESTVVDCTDEPRVTILRAGSVTAEEIAAIIPKLARATSNGELKSPGMLASHYAPGLPVRLGVTQPKAGEALIAFGGDVPAGAKKTINLSVAGDLREAAANLFAMLRALDSPEFTAIAVMPIPEEGIGEAINDRLRRASMR